MDTEPIADTISEHNNHSTNGGIMGKLTKVSPFIILAAGLGGGFITNQIANSVQSAKQDQAIIQLQTSQSKTIQDVEQLRADAVPRSEHQAMLDANKTISHWIEKYNDSMHNNIQHEIDELRKNCQK